MIVVRKQLPANNRRDNSAARVPAYLLRRAAKPLIVSEQRPSVVSTDDIRWFYDKYPVTTFDKE